MKSAGIPALSDFPPGTQFIIKEFDLPLAKVPVDGKVEWQNWFGGTPQRYDLTRLRVDNNWPADSFEQWAKVVADSLRG